MRRALLATIFVLASARAVTAQSVPGNAPGSQTGDTGAAYAGLASAPEANFFTGIAQTSIPIEVPPGRLGLAPVLALSYSSTGGPGAYGHGWTLPIPRVHRSTRRGVPRYDDSDSFVLEMPGAMVELERIPGSARGYRAEVESAFLRIGFDDGANLWKVIDKLGVTFVFGSSALTRTGRGPSRNETFAWMLQHIEDPAGNRIDFSYRSGTGMVSSGLPERIRYGANSRTGQPHFAEVVFEWTALQHSTRISWRDGYTDPLDVHLASVSTFTHDLPARRYDFSFEEVDVSADLRLAAVTLTAFAEAESDDVQPPSTVFVYSPTLHEGWPALGDAAPGAQPYEIPMAGHLRLGRNTVTADSVDLNGDSIVDRIDATPRPPVVSLGTGRGFDAAGSWNWPAASSAPRAVRKSDANGNLLTNVFDLDGDSFADLVDSNPSNCGAAAGYWCVWRGSASGFASSSSTWRSPVTLLRATGGGSSNVVSDLVDMDADGRLDIVDARSYSAATPSWSVYRNTGAGFATTPMSFPAPFPYLVRSDAARVTHGLFDINADSLPDVVVADAARSETTRWGRYEYWEVYFNQGNRFAATSAHWQIDGGVGDGIGLPNFVSLRANDGTTIADLFDITGDGRPDLVRRTRGLEPGFSGVPHLCQAASRCSAPDEEDSAVSNGYCCFNLLVFVNTGSSFSQPIGWSSPAHGLRADFETCPYAGTNSICSLSFIYDFDFFDVDGDGLVDFVERHTSGQKPYSWMVHPHPASAAGGGARPNLLVAMRNGVGGETMLHYRAAAGTPETRLPYPHWMVAERELRDSIYDQAPLLTSFAYRGGFFDIERREMRGFALVQETDPSGNLRVREYHQDRRRAGRMLRMTNLAAPSCIAADPDDPADPCSPWHSPLGVTEYEWPSSGPVLVASESDVPWHDGEPVENLRRTTTYAYDAFGSVATRTVSTPLAATSVTTTRYVRRLADASGGFPQTYLVSKPDSVVVTEAGRTSPLVERRFEYDWDDPAPASLTSASTCMTWNGAECVRWSRRWFEYEDNGNTTVAHAPGGATTRTIYDDHALFAAKSVNPVGLETTSVTDPRTGLVTETIPPGGNRLRSRYDGLGRLVRIWGPGTTKVDPLRSIDYAPGSLGDSPPRAVLHDAVSGAQATFFDGLGRVVATKRESRDGDRPVSMVAGLKLYDERSLVVAEALPFASDDLNVGRLREEFADAPAWLEYGYDEAARLVSTRAPDGTATITDRSSPGILRTDDANVVGGEHDGTVTLELFDGLGRRIQRDSCDGRPFAVHPYECRDGKLLRREMWTYDGLGRIVESTTEGLGIAAGDSVTRVARDGLGNRSSVFHSNAGTWTFVSNDDGRLIETHKPDGTVLETSYDASGRIRRRRGPTSRATYTYHKSGGGIGKLRRLDTRSGDFRVTETSTYDDRGRIETRHRRVAVRHSDPRSILVRYRYDDLDRRTGTSVEGWDPLSAEVTTTFDSLGREQSVNAGGTSYVVSSAYDPEGRVRRMDYGNGVTDLVDFESRSNELGTSGILRCLRSTNTASADGGACVARADDLEAVRYTDYDDSGRLLRIEDALRGDGSEASATRTYAYDALGRLASETNGAGTFWTFAFDPLGNLVEMSPLSLEYRDADHPSRLTSIHLGSEYEREYHHDANGRRRGDGDNTYEYDDWDRLSAARFLDSEATTYGYSDTGERIITRGPDGTEVELGDGIRVRGNRIERTIAFAGRAVAIERYFAARGRTLRPRDAAPPDVVFLHADHQQSTTLVTDENGHVVEHRRYAPFGGMSGVFDASGKPTAPAPVRSAFTGHSEDRESGLLFMGARHYDPATGSFLTLDPGMQFASPYAYSDGNPISGRDPDGKVFQLTALEIAALLAGTASFIDSIVSTGDLGHSLTAGVFAGFSVYLSSQLSTALAKPFAGTGHTWLQMTASIASSGFQALDAVEAIEDGRYAGGAVAAGMLAASLIGIESVNDPGAGTTPGETQERHGIKDRGMIDGRQVLDVNGICATRPGCLTNTLLAAQENLRVLFGGKAACVGGCQHVAELAKESLDNGRDVLLRCNSFGSIKCLGALQQEGLAKYLNETGKTGAPKLIVEMSGSPLLRPPSLRNVTYQVNLFDPVTWVGTAYSLPFNSDVVLGKNWWVPTPVIVHHSRMYEKPFFEAAGSMLP